MATGVIVDLFEQDVDFVEDELALGRHKLEGLAATSLYDLEHRLAELGLYHQQDRGGGHHGAEAQHLRGPPVPQRIGN